MSLPSTHTMSPTTHKTTVNTTFPCKNGETLRIRNAGGARGLWRSYTIHNQTNGKEYGPRSYYAAVDLAPGTAGVSQPGAV